MTKEKFSKKAIKLTFPCSNNQAEYEALAIGLDLAKEMKVSTLKIYEDSNLIIRQVNGDFVVKEPNLTKYREEIQRRLKDFKNYELEFVPRSKNKYPDALATLVLKLGTVQEDVIQIPLEVKAKPVAATSQERSSWIQEIKQKLENSELKDIKEIKAFMLLKGQLYKKMGMVS